MRGRLLVPRVIAAAVALAAAVSALGGCGAARPVHVAHPLPDPGSPDAAAGPRDPRAFGGDILVRVALHWSRGNVSVRSTGALTFHDDDGSGRIVPIDKGDAIIASCDGSEVRLRTASGRVLSEGTSARVTADGGRLVVDGREIRGDLRFAARLDSLFVVNELPLEDYLRGVVPKEIGPRPPADREAVAAQAIAARTYTVKRLNQYESLPFDLFGDVQDQVYDGVSGEQSTADEAILETRGLVLADDRALIETFYSSTCGGARSDIAAVWPHRAVHPALRGGPDGPRGREWCRESRHFEWEETWDGAALGEMFRRYAPALLELQPGSIRGELRDVRVTKRGPSGRAALIEWETDRGRWTVPGDKNRWILRRPDGGILRSVLIKIDVVHSGRSVSAVRVRGQGNGHGVGMCQVGALGQARTGRDFREILRSYYPGTKVRAIRGSDLPPGRPRAS